jgi:glycosyltransferase involved in cell wall biosynthesis
LSKREIKYSSDKVFEGSRDSTFYGEKYFLNAEGSNYGCGGFIPYDERYLERDRATIPIIRGVLREHGSELKSAIVLGCARGYLIQAFKEQNVEAVGVDISEWAVENCAEGVEGHIFCGDVCDLSKWRDGEFTVAVAFDIFEHITVPDLYKAIKESCRVAEWVLINLPINPDDETPDMSAEQDKSHVSVYSKTWWIQQFMAVGYEPVDVQEWTPRTLSPKSRWSDKKDHNVTIYFRKAEKNVAIKKVSIPLIRDGGKGFKILWWSNGPWAGTGYGKGTKYVVYPLNEHYDVACLAYWGLEGAALTFNGLKVFPKMYDQFGIDAADLICRNWKPDIMVTLFDIWIGDSPLFNGERDWFSKIHSKHVAYFPVDHHPMPVPILNQAKKAYHCVAMSRFGLNELRNSGIEASYIPHGVETKVFAPIEDNTESRKWLIDTAGVPLFNGEENEKWDNDSFIIGKVAANKDTARKGFDREMAALRIFFEQNPDAKKDTRMYWHTDPRFPGGFHLDHYAHLMGVDKYIKKTHPFYVYGGVSEQNMAKMYQSFNLFTNVSRAEGFGIPILEAQSSGIPVVANDCTSMTELVKNHGWLCKPRTWEPTALLSNVFIADEYEIAKAYSEAYNNPDKLKSYGVASRDFAEQYDWDNVITPLWLQLIEKLREDLRPKTLDERRMN